MQTFVPDLVERNRNRVQIEVLGYGEDSRELFDIPEVRRYFQTLFECVVGLFYWIDIDSHMFVFLGLMLYAPIRVLGEVTISPQDLEAFLLRGVIGLNRFCELTGASPDESTATINKRIRAM